MQLLLPILLFFPEAEGAASSLGGGRGGEGSSPCCCLRLVLSFLLELWVLKSLGLHFSTDGKGLDLTGFCHQSSPPSLLPQHHPVLSSCFRATLTPTKEPLKGLTA